MSDEKTNMRCCICESTDKWKCVDEYRVIAKGMHICMGCGFVSYPSLYKTEKEIIEFYRQDYRRKPSIGNLYTGNRKLLFHDIFLRPVFDEWKKKGIEAPVIGEVGSAYGLFLNWIRATFFPKAELHGTELTTGFKRVAFHEYGLNLKDDLDPNVKYDMICSYKVAEHQMDVDKKLLQYKNMLKEDGLLYISVPTWFDRLTNFGMDGTIDLEYYYDPSHINVWTRKLFESLLKKVGLEVIKYNDTLYGDTYLCKRNDELMLEARAVETPSKVIEMMAKIKKAYEHFSKHEYKEAIEAWPRFPLGWANYYENNRALFHKNGNPNFEDIFNHFCKPFLELCPTEVDAYRFAADLNMRYDRYPHAIEYLQKALSMRDNTPVLLSMLSHCFYQLALKEQNQAKKNDLILTARNIQKHIAKIDLQSVPEAINWIYAYSAELPTPFENKAA